MEFIIYNLSNENIIVRIPCGGGHRSWDCIISHTKARFAYIKDKQVHVHNLSSSFFPSCPILQVRNINLLKMKQLCKFFYICFFYNLEWFSHKRDTLLAIRFMV